VQSVCTTVTAVHLCSYAGTTTLQVPFSQSNSTLTEARALPIRSDLHFTSSCFGRAPFMMETAHPGVFTVTSYSAV
jgi:hypothetical protein